MTKFERKFGEDFLSKLPNSPGIYFIYNAAGTLFYIGKAKSLRRRLTQYRDAGRGKKHKKMRRLVDEGCKIEWQECASDLEASVKETRLIQTLRPLQNISGAYSFLYPLVGVRSEGKSLYFCFTTHPESFPQYTFHGCFRSRRLTREAFHSLKELLKYLGHPMSKKEILAEGVVPHSRVLGFRQMNEGWTPKWNAFFSGQSREALTALVESLIEKPGARREAELVQKSIRQLKRFFRYEAKPLATAISETEFPHYPVGQLDRDPLFLTYRLKSD